MILRNAQIAALKRRQRAAFVVEMQVHLRKHFPARLSELGSRELSEHVENALDDAGRYGLTTCRDLARYLNLAVEYGWDFDRKAGQAWMRRILSDPAVSDPSVRLQRLVSACIRRRALARIDQELASQFEATKAR